MERNKEFFTQYKQLISDYIGHRLLLLKLEGVSKMAKLVSLAVAGLAVALIGGLVILFLSLMGGYFFSELFHNYFLGFGLIALIYVIILVVLIIIVKKRILSNFIAGIIINIIFEKTADHDNRKPEDEK